MKGMVRQLENNKYVCEFLIKTVRASQNIFIWAGMFLNTKDWNFHHQLGKDNNKNGHTAIKDNQDSKRTLCENVYTAIFQ